MPKISGVRRWDRQLPRPAPGRGLYGAVTYPHVLSGNVHIEVDEHTADVLQARAAELGVTVSILSTPFSRAQRGIQGRAAEQLPPGYHELDLPGVADVV